MIINKEELKAYLKISLENNISGSAVAELLIRNFQSLISKTLEELLNEEEAGL